MFGGLIFKSIICYALPMKFRSLLLALFLISPLFSYAASVFINEVAWMGTTASASDEWIELYNAGSTDVDISGWTLALFKPASTTPTKINNTFSRNFRTTINTFSYHFSSFLANYLDKILKFLKICVIF